MPGTTVLDAMIAESATRQTVSAVTLIATLVLVAVLIAKEAVTAVDDDRGRPVGRLFDVVAVPLLIVFLAKVAERLL
jgi:hypothetical protein